MFKPSLIAAALTGLLVLPGLAQAQTQSEAPDIHALATPEVIQGFREMLEVPVILMSIEAQNERREGLSQDDIDALDKQWRAETESDHQPLIAATLSSPASSYLTKEQADARGLFAALFVMDKYGLNVGQSATTSDYWQGDEAKFKKTFPKGDGTVFIDEPEYDEAFDTWLAQVNMTISKDGEVIGTATVELDVNELARRARLAR